MRGEEGNDVEKMFWGRINIRRASAYMLYHPGADSRLVVLGIKYFNKPKTGQLFGRIMAAELNPTDFFKGIDVIVPIPLAKEKQRKRGYNQSEQIAIGISEVTKLPIESTAVERVISNPSQTGLHGIERTKNVEGIFSLVRPESLRGKHILLVDDVITTGATLISCAKEIEKAGGVTFSVLVLAWTK